MSGIGRILRRSQCCVGVGFADRQADGCRGAAREVVIAAVNCGDRVDPTRQRSGGQAGRAAAQRPCSHLRCAIHERDGLSIRNHAFAGRDRRGQRYQLSIAGGNRIGFKRSRRRRPRRVDGVGGGGHGAGGIAAGRCYCLQRFCRRDGDRTAVHTRTSRRRCSVGGVVDGCPSRSIADRHRLRRGVGAGWHTEGWRRGCRWLIFPKVVAHARISIGIVAVSAKQPEIAAAIGPVYSAVAASGNVSGSWHAQRAVHSGLANTIWEQRTASANPGPFVRGRTELP